MDVGPFGVRLGVVVHAAGVELDALGGQVGLALGAVAEGAAGAVGQHPLVPRIVGVVDGHVAALEEDGLGVAVFLHGVVEVQVILAEVGEDAHGEADAVYPVQGQCVGGDLHHHMGAARVGHLAEQLLQLEGFGGGALGVQHLVADHVLDGAHQTHLGPGLLLQDALDEIGGGGLAAGAGNADHGHLAGGMVEPVGGHQRQRLAGAFHLHIGDIPLRHTLTHHTHGTLFRRYGDEPVAVHRLAADGHEHVARRGGAGVIADAGDLLRHIGGGREHLKALQYVVQFHMIVSLSLRFWGGMPRHRPV